MRLYAVEVNAGHLTVLSGSPIPFFDPGWVTAKSHAPAHMDPKGAHRKLQPLRAAEGRCGTADETIPVNLSRALAVETDRALDELRPCWELL